MTLVRRTCLLLWLGLVSTAQAQSLPAADPPFAGKIGARAADSTPAWPQPARAPEGAPDIILVMTDDTGFGAASTFGGGVETPALQALADRGLRYNRFHTTALCSPTRAALLSGRNHHRVGFGTVVEIGSGYPGYNALWKKSTASVAEILRQNGYSTGAFGKWHNTPLHDITPAGPFDRWPTGLGFDYFYGFLTGESNQYEVPLYRNTTPVITPPATAAQDYHVTTDVVDDAIHWMQVHEAVAPSQPFFLYFAPGATHAPLQVPQQWIDKYRGRFDGGWDRYREAVFARQKKLGVVPKNAKLTSRPDGYPAWNSLSADDKRVAARQMEVFAGFLEHTDHEIGRLVAASPDPENTLVLYIVGDNGASAEGGLYGSDNYGVTTFQGIAQDAKQQINTIDELGTVKHNNQYSAVWAWATNAPFQWNKQVASHLGGTRDPLVLAWPARIKNGGGLRSQFTHVNDVAPTLLEAADVPTPKTVNGIVQQPFDGTSFVYSFDDPKAASRHREQYFELLGNRAYYKDGWWAGAHHPEPAWTFIRKDNFEQDRWELYHLDEDFTQSRDLAAKYPEKLAELQAAFDAAAKANDVYPLINRPSSPAPSRADGRKEFVYPGDMPRLLTHAAPPLTGKPYRIAATLRIPAGVPAQGHITSIGGRDGGLAFFAQDGKLVFENNFAGRHWDRLVSTSAIPAGEVEVAYEFVKDEKGNAGTGRLFIGGQPVGEARIERISRPSHQGSFDISRVYSSPVGQTVEAPFVFNGVVETVRISLR